MQRFIEILRKIDPIWVLCLLAVIAVVIMFTTRYIMISDARKAPMLAAVEMPQSRDASAQATHPPAQASAAPAASKTPAPSPTPAPTLDPEAVIPIVLNTNSKTFHLDPECRSVRSMREDNRQDTETSIAELLDSGFKPCGNCAKGIG